MRYQVLPAIILLLSASTATVHARVMFRFDLQSLTYMSTAVIEGDVTAAERVHWVDKLTVKITRTYAGDLKEQDDVIVGLSAYHKIGKDIFSTARFGQGDHLILFIEPVTQQSSRDDGIPWWPVPSGLKLVSGDKVTGVVQESNPGPYVNAIDEGGVAEFRQKVADAVKWSADFGKGFAAKKADAAWLLEQLKARPPIDPGDLNARDYVAVVLCQAIANTRDKDAVSKAKEIRHDRYERQILDLPASREAER